MSSDLDQHVEWLSHDIALGFDVIFVHQVGCDQKSFLQAFGEHVLPRITQQRTARTPSTIRARPAEAAHRAWGAGACSRIP